MSTEAKFLIGASSVTLILIVSGVFFLSAKSKKAEQTATLGTKVENSVLLQNSKHTVGDLNAPVLVVEFADFQCPACATAHPIIKEILEANKEKVYFVYHHYPLSFHNNAQLAAQASEAAGEQGKFWEMHDLLYTNQKDWSDKSNGREIFEGYAQKLGLDIAKFKEDLKNAQDIVEIDYALGNRVGVESTPTFFINGEMHKGTVSLDQFQNLINSAIFEPARK